MVEEWRDIIGFEGYYQVSNLGQVKSLDRYVWNRFAHILRRGRILKENTDRYGYKYVNLKYGEIDKSLKTHRIVALNFIQNPLNLPQVNHIDGNKSNNVVSNLEWCNCSENVRHAYKTGLMNGDILGIGVTQINYNTSEVINIFPSLQEAARFIDGDASNIRKVCIGEKSHSKGFKWRFSVENINVGDMWND